MIRSRRIQSRTLFTGEFTLADLPASFAKVQNCCVCGKETQLRKRIRPCFVKDAVLQLLRLSPRLFAPECKAHSSSIWSTCYANTYVLRPSNGKNSILTVGVAAPSSTFLEALASVIMGASLLPPWVFSPRSTPETFRGQQGLANEYVTEWHLFWRALKPPERVEYLAKYEASAEWRDALMDQTSSWSPGFGDQ